MSFIQSNNENIFYEYYEVESDITIIYVGGHKTVAVGGRKSEPLKQYCIDNNISFIRFDYAGWGQSGDDHREWAVEEWLINLIDIIKLTDDKVVLVGNSMGGYLMLMAAMCYPEKVVGLFGIAAGFGEYIQETGKNVLRDPSETLEMSFDLVEGAHIISNVLSLKQPICLFHSMNDSLVPWATAKNIMSQIQSSDASLHLIKNGDHSMSRPEDISYMLQFFEQFLRKLPCKLK